MSYKQVKQYGYRDNLESGDPEKVIYGADFDGEFQAIEAAIEEIVGGDSGGGSVGVPISTTPPADPSSGDLWFDSTPGSGALYIYDGSVWFSSLSVDGG